MFGDENTPGVMIVIRGFIGARQVIEHKFRVY